jgi:sugar phosphate isomerase/epimerase
MDRLVLGTGRVGFPAIFKALEEGGYRGPYCLELLSDRSLEDSLWNWAPEKLVETNRTAFARLWEEARKNR